MCRANLESKADIVSCRSVLYYIYGLNEVGYL